MNIRLWHAQCSQFTHAPARTCHASMLDTNVRLPIAAPPQPHVAVQRGLAPTGVSSLLSRHAFHIQQQDAHRQKRAPNTITNARALPASESHTSHESKADRTQHGCAHACSTHICRCCLHPSPAFRGACTHRDAFPTCPAASPARWPDEARTKFETRTPHAQRHTHVTGPEEIHATIRRCGCMHAHARAAPANTAR